MNLREQVAQGRRIEPMCQRFEQAWFERRRPRIEDELNAVAEADRPALLQELLKIEWEYRRREPLELAEYTRRFASWLAVVEAVWQERQDKETADEDGTPNTADWTVPPAHRRETAEEPNKLPVVRKGYANLAELGRGGMGVVYRADDLDLNRQVALKMLLYFDAERLQRFRQEAKVLAQLDDANVVRVHGFDELDGQPVIVMEFVTGGNLADRLKQGPLPAAMAAKLVATLARSMAGAHARGVVHRDLKPANVLLGGDSRYASAENASPRGTDTNPLAGLIPKIADFGLARIHDDAVLTRSGAVAGTPAYMAPEQALGQTSKVGPWTDVWALGVILHECLTGQQLFQGESWLDILEKVKQGVPRSLMPMDGVPAELSAICQECLLMEPTSRPTANDLARRLDCLGKDVQPVRESNRRDKAPTLPSPGRRRWSWRAVAVAVIVLCLAGLGMTAGLVGWGQGPEVTGSGKHQTPPRITKFSVIHRRPAVKDGKVVTENHGEIGKDSFEVRFNDAVQFDIAVAPGGYLFLLAFNADGKEQLLWPEDPRTAPSKVSQLKWPPKQPNGEEGGVYLNDEPNGGLQALAVVVSKEPLPTYDAWRVKRGLVAWEKLPGGRGVWLANTAGGEEDNKEAVSVTERAAVGGLPGSGEGAMQKRLKQIVRTMRQDGDEAVEVLAFPVRAKEGE